MSNIIDYIPFVMFSICDFKKMSVLEGKVTQNVSGSTDVTRTVSGSAEVTQPFFFVCFCWFFSTVYTLQDTLVYFYYVYIKFFYFKICMICPL